MTARADEMDLTRSWEQLHGDVVARGRRLRRRRRIATGLGAAAVIAVLSVVTVLVPQGGSDPSVRTVAQPGVVDGDAVAFVRTYADGAGGTEILVLHAPDAPPASLSPDRAANDGSPSLSPDGRWILFQSERDNPLRGVKRVTDIYRMRTDGSGLRRITVTDRPGLGNGVRHPVWSPDGRFIAAARENASDDSRIVVMRADGSDPRVISAGNGDVGPVWSPDGHWIAYRFRPPGAEEELWVVHPDGRRAHRVVRGVHDSPIAWSPDGRITFSRAVGGDVIRLFSVQPDGRALHRLRGADGVADLGPAWSGSGRALVYSADPNQQTRTGRAADGTAVDGTRAGHLVAADPSGRIRRTLTAPPPGADDGSAALGPAR
jgi:Tol biopolymer transport system component